jgi:hypothetical protein
MKNFIASVAVIIFASSVLQPFLPWYVIAAVAFAAGYLIKQNLLSAFSAGFIAIFLLWVSYAFVLSHANNDLLARKVAAVLPLNGSVHLLLLITGIIGGLISGFSALTGRLAARL